MPRPKFRSKPAAKGAWLGAVGLSSGLHVAGLAALPVLLGWSWWEWSRPSPGGLDEPVTVRWAVAQAPEDSEETPTRPLEALEAAFEEPEWTPTEGPELEWQETRPEAPLPREELTPERESHPAPIGDWRKPLLAPEPQPVEATVPPKEVVPQPAPEPIPTEPEDPGEPVEIEWTPRPSAQHCPEPPYPAKYQRRGWQGTVRLRLTVEPDGSVRQVEVLQSSGYDPLDEVARSTLAAWRFEPGPAGSKAKQIQRQVEFRL